MEKRKLDLAGINYDEGLARFGNNNQIYERFLLKFFSDNQLPDLKELIKKNDYDKAFRLCHDLKGMTGNLSMDVLYTDVCRLVEALRSKDEKADYNSLLKDIDDAYAKAEKAVKGN